MPSHNSTVVLIRHNTRHTTTNGMPWRNTPPELHGTPRPGRQTSRRRTTAMSNATITHGLTGRFPKQPHEASPPSPLPSATKLNNMNVAAVVRYEPTAKMPESSQAASSNSYWTRTLELTPPSMKWVANWRVFSRAAARRIAATGKRTTSNAVHEPHQRRNCAASLPPLRPPPARNTWHVGSLERPPPCGKPDLEPKNCAYVG